MSGVEIVVGTIACVAAVVSAYRDGGTIIQKIKLKRSQKRAAPPSRLLEESIDQAPADIEREKQRGIQRFGKAFENGDTIAIIALQQITIQLQGSLLEELRNAAFDDAITDFRYLVDVADAGRDKTMNTLIELRQRLLVAEPLGNDLSPSTTHSSMPSIASGKQRASLPLPAPSSPPPRGDLKSAQTWAQSSHAASRDASGEEDSADGADNNPRKSKHRGSLLGIFRHRTSSHGGGTGTQTPTIAMDGAQESPRPASPVHGLPPRAHTVATDARSSISAGSTRAASVHSGHTVATTWNYQPWEVRESNNHLTGKSLLWCTDSQQDDPAKIWGATKPGASSPDMHQDRPASSSPPMARPSVTPTWNRNSSVAVPLPVPENNYLGFCKNAVRLQNGDRGAFEKCAEHAYSRSGYSNSTTYYLSCRSSKCSYMSQLKADTIWDRVWTDPELNIKWRWAFLAKSHVQQKQVKGQQFCYQCLFCTFANGKGAVYHGSRMYLKHVASHRGEIGEVLKFKAACINDHVCEDDEDFDINLYPLEAGEAREREPSQVLSDELVGLGFYPPKPEPADSVYGASEPWNAGLSNFHYGGDVDRTELE